MTELLVNWEEKLSLWLSFVERLLESSSITQEQAKALKKAKNDSLQNNDKQNTLIQTKKLPIIVNQKIEKKQAEAEEKINIATKYTQHQFTSYASEKENLKK